MNGTTGTSARAGCSPPTKRASHESVPPATTYGQGAPDTAHPNDEKHREGRGHDAQGRPDANRSGWIKQREDDQAKRIVGDSEEQEKRDRGMIAEDRLHHEVAEGDVGRARDRPSPGELGLALKQNDRGVDEGGTDHAAGRGDDRQGRPRPGVKRAAGRGGLHDLLGHEGEEKRHADVVHREVQRAGEPFVTCVRAVGPDERDHGPDRQDERELDDPPQEAAGTRSRHRPQNTSFSPVRIL